MDISLKQALSFSHYKECVSWNNDECKRTCCHNILGVVVLTQHFVVGTNAPVPSSPTPCKQASHQPTEHYGREGEGPGRFGLE